MPCCFVLVPPQPLKRCSRARPQALKSLTRDLPIVEMKLLGADYLIVFVPLSRNEDDVAGPGLADGGADGFAPIRDHAIGHLWPPLERLADADLHFVNDSHRILRSRIIRRQDDDVALLHGCAAHLGTFATITIPAAAEHGDDSMSFHGLRGRQQSDQCIWSMGVIHDDREVLAGRHTLESTGHIHDPGRSLLYLGWCRAGMQSHTDGAKQVIDVVLADQTAFDRERSSRSCSCKSCPSWRQTHTFGFQLGLVGEGIAPHWHWTGCADLDTVGIVEVYDRPLPSLLSLSETGEEPQLGLKVIFHVGVKI